MGDKIKSSTTELLQIILNDYIPKNKINKFIDLISEYGFKNLTYFTDEKEIKINNNKIPLDILKKLNTKIKEIEDPKIEEEDSKDKNILLNKCDEFFNKIDFLKKRNKYYYYYFGCYLKKFKDIYILEHSIEEFNNFIKERYEIKLTKLYNYIKFYNLCNEYKILLNCDLTFTEIINNYSEIKKLLIKT